MKKLIALLLALMLPLCASAETLREQLSAPETYEATYYSNTKRTQITVDAAVYVPDVAQVPIYAVTVRDFTAGEGWLLARLTEPEGEWQRVDRPGDIQPDSLCHSLYGAGDQFEATEMNLNLYAPYTAYLNLTNSYHVGVFNRQPDARVLKYRWHDPQTQAFFPAAISLAHADAIGQDITGQTLTIDEATLMANAFIAEIAPEYELRIAAATQGETITAQKTDDMAYCFGYTRSIGGVPITYVSHEIVLSDFVDTPMAPAPGQELITLVIHQGKVVSFNWQDPYEIGEVLQPSAALLPFEQIMSIFAYVAPLSVQRTETERAPDSEAINGMNITEIRLGYMPILKKDDPNQWELRPVWDFIGTRVHPLTTVDWPCYSLLTIDAVDGTIIDRNYGY